MLAIVCYIYSKRGILFCSFVHSIFHGAHSFPLLSVSICLLPQKDVDFSSFLSLCRPLQVTQVVWNLSKNTQNDIFPVVWNLVLCKAVKEWVWGWNFVVIYAKVKLLSCSVYSSIAFNTPLFSVLSVVLVYSINACFADLTLKFPLLLQYLSTQMSYFF